MRVTNSAEIQPMFVGGEWVSTDRTIPIYLPYDGSLVATVAEADLATLDRAIDAAQRAAPVMAAMSNGERSELLFRVKGLLEAAADEFAQLLCLETGKPIREARIEVERASQTLLESAIAARELSGEIIPIDAARAGKGRMALTVREPLGVIGAITPFNVPLNLALHKVGPALAGGNAVVHKPSENTPLSALRLARVFEAAGLPPGAYNVVAGGEEIGRAIVADPRIQMITFTGSVAVGKAIRASSGLKRVTLELGGNCGVLIEPDADLALAMERCVPGAFAHSGQVCISVQRIYVHESIRESFLQGFCSAAERLVIGHPLEERTDLSSLINEVEAARVEQWIADAVQKGAGLRIGGGRQYATIPPTILTDLPGNAQMSCNEVFGPVVAVNSYRDRDQAIDQINATPYGLQAGVFTRNLENAFEAARRLTVGGVLINDVPNFRADNMPYGGAKESGIGREGPRYAIEEMTETKLICWR
jgi:acyl-CoA reductase-like NAD-dependent aldehyde dehydrogenase